MDVRFPPGEARFVLLMDELRKRATRYDFSVVETSLLIAQVVDEIFGLFEPFYAEGGLSRNGYAILLLLRSAPGLTPQKLALHLNLSKSAMTGLLDTLLKGGFITRKSAVRDKRSVEVSITAAGEAIVRTLIPNHLQLHQRLLDGMNKAELKRLTKLFAQVRKNVRALRRERITAE